MEGSPVLEVVDSPLDADGAIRAGQPLPEALPVLPLRDTVTYPDTLTPLAVGQDRSIQLVNDVLSGDRMLVMLGSKDPDLDTPGPDQLHTVGVAGVVARMLKVPDGSLRILVQAGQRVRIDEWVGEEPYLMAKVSELPDERALADARAPDDGNTHRSRIVAHAVATRAVVRRPRVPKYTRVATARHTANASHSPRVRPVSSQTMTAQASHGTAPPSGTRKGKLPALATPSARSRQAASAHPR